MKLICKYKDIQSLCWVFIVICLVWQIIFSKISILSNVALGIIVMMNIFHSKYNTKVLLSIILSVAFLFCCSILLSNIVALAIRFTIIIFFLLCAYMTNINVKPCIKILYYVTFPFVLALLCYELILLILPGLPIHELIAYYIKFVMKAGSIFPAYGFMYKIQLKGAAIIPFVYMLSYIIDVFPVKYKQLLRVMYLMGIIISGNFAYLVSIFTFHLINPFLGKQKKSYFYKRYFAYSLILICSFSFIISFVSKTLEDKKEISNATRFDQANVLFSDMMESPLTFFMGKGLGNTVDVVTSFRDYTGATYYELQSLYFLNQMGVIPFTLFILANICFVLKFIKNNHLKLLYCAYIIYAVTNPYILDTTQVVVIITLISAQSYISNPNLLIWKKRSVC